MEIIGDSRSFRGRWTQLTRNAAISRKISLQKRLFKLICRNRLEFPLQTAKNRKTSIDNHVKFLKKCFISISVNFFEAVRDLIVNEISFIHRLYFLENVYELCVHQLIHDFLLIRFKWTTNKVTFQHQMGFKNRF